MTIPIWNHDQVADNHLERLAVTLRRAHDIAIGKKAELDLARVAYETAREAANAAYSDENVARSALLNHIQCGSGSEAIGVEHDRFQQPSRAPKPGSIPT